MIDSLYGYAAKDEQIDGLRKIGLKAYVDSGIALAILFTVATASAASAQTPRAGGVTVRQSDSLINGAVIGAGVAVASGLFVCTRMEPWEICRDDFGPMIKIGAIGAGIGIGIDALIRKKVYQSASGATEVHAAPLIGRRAKGLKLSIMF